MQIFSCGITTLKHNTEIMASAKAADVDILTLCEICTSLNYHIDVNVTINQIYHIRLNVCLQNEEISLLKLLLH